MDCYKEGNCLCRKRWLIVAASAFLLSGAAQIASAQDTHLTTDPFVQNALRIQNFEPGGQFFPSGLSVRGSVIPDTRMGSATLIPTSSTLVGNQLFQNAAVQGQYSYTIGLSDYHPHSVHSPFDSYSSVTRSISEETENKQVQLDLDITGRLTHPADGYDGAQGGGFPPPNPLGAIDIFNISFQGSAQGMYILSSTEASRRRDRATWAAPAVTIMTAHTWQALQTAATGYRDDSSQVATLSSLVGTTLANFIKPLPNQSSPEFQRAGLLLNPLKDVQVLPGLLSYVLTESDDVGEITRDATGAILDEAVPGLGLVVVLIDPGINEPDERANVVVRGVVKYGGGVAAVAGVTALVGTPLGWVAVPVAVGGAYVVGEVYDYAGPAVREWARDIPSDVQAGFDAVMNVFTGASPNPFSPNSATNPGRDWRWSLWSGI